MIRTLTVASTRVDRPLCRYLQAANRIARQRRAWGQNCGVSIAPKGLYPAREVRTSVNMGPSCSSLQALFLQDVSGDGGVSA